MKRLLLDTQVLLWWLADDPSLGGNAKKTIVSGQNEVFVSAASAWEISIKKALGKLEAPDDMDTIVEDEQFIKLPITLYHGQMAGALPAYHRDPFDRMLVVQAQSHGLALMTSDSIFSKYGVSVLQARD